MSLIGAPLNQAQIDGSAQVMVTGEVGSQILISSVILCNTTTRCQTVRLYFDADGETFDETTAIVWDLVVRPNQYKELHFSITLDSLTNAFAVSGSGGVTATLFGARRDIQ